MPRKLLLADDSVTIQRVIELTFSDEDIVVSTVSDGQQAIDQLDVDPPDILLVDVDLPKRDGYEVAAYVRSRPTLAHIPVVLLTGAFEPIDEVRAAGVGSTDVLAKPFEPQLVVSRVRELLERKPANFDAAGGGASASLDDYFDQLDAAFADRRGTQPRSVRAVDDHEWSSAPVRTTTAAVAKAAPAPSNPFAELKAARAEAASHRTAAPAMSEEVLEDIVSRVLQRLSDKVIRETVADIVAETAERLVREEIERIKTRG